MIRALVELVSVGAVVGAVGAGAYTGTRSLEVDYTAVPADPVAVHEHLSGLSTSLVDAVKAAEAETGGLAHSVCGVIKDDTSMFEVYVYTNKECRRVMVNAETGAIAVNESQPQFPGKPVEGKLVELSSGLKYFDLVVGGGAQPAGPTSQVTVHYTGYFVDGEKFDSSVDRGQPATFPLNRVIPGWTEGVGSMKIGGVRKLIIPGDLAYGPQGRPGRIPPNATLIFDVELISIADQ
jgi:FKBP-type peptidyl-prolyl cis-trans isomerase